MTRLRTFRHLLLLLCAWFAMPAMAHKASDSYLALQVNGREVAGQWDIALRDIDFAIGLDANGDGDITWGEVQARRADIAAWALGRLKLERGGDCSLRATELLVDGHTDGTYAVLRLAGTCPSDAPALALGYRLLFDIDQLHRGLLRLEVDGVSHTSVLGPDSGVLNVRPARLPGWRSSDSTWWRAPSTSGSASTTSCSCCRCCCPPCWCTNRGAGRACAVSAPR